MEGITHCEDAPPAGGPNERELPDPSCAGAAAAALLNAAALGFLPVRPMPPLSPRGIKEQLQAEHTKNAFCVFYAIITVTIIIVSKIRHELQSNIASRVQ